MNHYTCWYYRACDCLCDAGKPSAYFTTTTWCSSVVELWEV